MAERTAKANLVICATGSSHIALLPAHLGLIRSSLPVDVQVVMSSAAATMLSPNTLEICGVKVWTDQDRVLADGRPTHIALIRWLDIALVLPASANSIGKIANGLCDDLGRLIFTGASDAKRAIAPAMNECLWMARAVQRNLRLLQEDGVEVIDPAAAQPFADGDVGRGFSPTPRRVIDYLSQVIRDMPSDHADLVADARNVLVPN